MSRPSQKTGTRTQAQRERILAAAQCCFMRTGFYGASIAMIAESAGMSSGLIYRYFASKSAIIFAIVEQELEKVRCMIQQMPAAEDLAEGIVAHFEAHDTGSNDSVSSALCVEMSAEATRDPQIAAALKRFDEAVSSELIEWLARSESRGGHGLPAGVARERALLLSCLVEGLTVLRAREPDLDRDLLRRSLNVFTNALLTGSRRRCT